MAGLNIVEREDEGGGSEGEETQRSRVGELTMPEGEGEVEMKNRYLYAASLRRSVDLVLWKISTIAKTTETRVLTRAERSLYSRSWDLPPPLRPSAGMFFST